ncbi:MAG: amidohydrolase family protein [Planctomycetota bacterium]
MNRRDLSILIATAFATLVACGTSRGENPTVLIRAKHVHTMAGETLSPGMVLVRDGKIAEVAESISVDPMPQVLEVDSVMPGMVNAQSTVGLVGSGGEASREVTPEFETVGMIDFESRDFREAIDGGETTVHIMPSTDNVIAGWTCLIKTMGGDPDSRSLLARKGVALSMCSDPAGRNRSRSRPDSIFVRQPTNRMGVVWILRNQLQQAKYPSPGKDSGATGALSEMLSGKAPAFGVSRTTIDIQSLLTIAEEFGFAPIVVGGHEAYDVIDLLKETDTTVIYTAVDERPVGAEGSELFWATPTRLRDAEIPFCIAGDGLLEKMRLAVRFGLTADEAMKSVTVDAANVLGLSDSVGKIAVGCDADLLGFSGPPTQMTSALQWVLINGERVASPSPTSSGPSEPSDES